MANFQNNAITDAGRNLLSHVQMGAVFTPTKIVLGSGYLPAGTTVRTITAVVSPVKNLTINKKKRANDGTVTIGGMYSNQDVVSDFYFRELALYAKAIYEDGTEIAEVLYSYGNAGDAAELMPAYSSGNPVERQMDLVVYIGNDSQVDLTIESGVYVTIDMLGDYVGLTEDKTYHVSTTGNDTTGDGSQSAPFATIAKALEELPKDLGGHTVTINVAAGTYSESRVNVTGFTSGNLIIKGPESATKPVISNGIQVQGCAVFVTLQYLSCTSSNQGASGIIIANSQQVTIDTCYVTSATAQQNHGILIDTMSTGYITGCSVQNCNYAVLARNARAVVYSLSGGGNRIGFYATTGGDLRIREFTGTASVVYYTEFGGRIYYGSQANVPAY